MLDKIRPKCDECGSMKVYSGGKRRFGGKEYQHWECQDCGKCWGKEANIALCIKQMLDIASI
jgi:transposase-like protein